MKLRYQTILAKKQISESALPENIRAVISELNTIQDQLKQDDSEEIDPVLLEQFKELDNDIIDLISDEFDDETEEDDSPLEIKENILKSLFASGTTKTTLQKLAQLGYDISSLKKGEVVGSFRVSIVEQKFVTPYFIIEKIK